MCNLLAELHDIVVDHLWDDPHSLAACGLVCRAWLPTTRLHLFRSVHLLHRRYDLITFDDILHGQCSTLPAVAPYVRDLGLDLHKIQTHIDVRYAVWADDGSRFYLSDIEASNYHIIQIASALNNVRSLCLHNIAFDGVKLRSDTAKSLVVMGHNLESITLQDVYFGEPSPLLQLLGASPLLSSISMDDVLILGTSKNPTQSEDGDDTHPSNPEGRSATGQKPATIEHLGLVGCREQVVSVVMQKLRGPSFRHQWRSFSLRVSELGPNLDLLLLNVASLQTLQLSYSFVDYSTSDAFPDLSQLYALKSVHIMDFMMLRIHQPIHAGLQRLADMLSTIRSPVLEKIMFTHISWGSMDDGWAPLDAVLAAFAARAPLRVVISIFAKWDWGKTATLEDNFRSRLPLSLAEGACIELTMTYRREVYGEIVVRL